MAEVVEKNYTQVGPMSSEEELKQGHVKPILTISQAVDCVEDLRRYVEQKKI